MRFCVGREQGQEIGKVGSTGLATGPHVCYRFWKDGKQVDALKLKLPNSEPLVAKDRPRYFKYIAPLKKELDSIANLKFNPQKKVTQPVKRQVAKPTKAIQKNKSYR